ncbi:unnamed protein product [Heligmosomoides polygyrus]|uniref:DUF5617 domain-containing protein n=1 Tax=Heligmosomoides polygyrus TaxID=6339 RepID=A0A183FIH7_HELPZ|nr:unnamed protein product [Heligmosomoides polygyrus]
MGLLRTSSPQQSMEAESLKATDTRLSPEALELIRQRGAARASGNYELMFEFANLCRASIKEDLKESRAEVLAGAAEARLSIHNAHRSFANFKTKMAALRHPNRISPLPEGSPTIPGDSGDFYSDLLDSHLRILVMLNGLNAGEDCVSLLEQLVLQHSSRIPEAVKETILEVKPVLVCAGVFFSREPHGTMRIRLGC